MLSTRISSSSMMMLLNVAKESGRFLDSHPLLAGRLTEEDIFSFALSQVFAVLQNEFGVAHIFVKGYKLMKIFHTRHCFQNWSQIWNKKTNHFIVFFAKLLLLSSHPI